MTIEAIKNAITALAPEDRHSLVSWLNELDYDAWDQQMLQDFSPGGRGMAWVDQVKREIDDGSNRSLGIGAQARGRKNDPEARSVIS